jgi:hypothetical protein
MDNQNPFMDHAAPVISSEPAIDDQQKSDLWEAFHSKSPEALIQHLTPLAVPDDFKRRLLEAKRASLPAPAPVDKVTDAVNRIAKLDPQTRQIAEGSPNLLKAFTTATTEPKAPAAASSEPASTSPAAGKGKKTSEASAASTVPADVPATPSAHALIHASNGGHYHVPVENLDKVRAKDPGMTVLHVEP